MPKRPDPADAAAYPAVIAEAARLDATHTGVDAAALVARAVGTLFPGRIALVSSFGADAAVLLHMVAQADRHTPVLFAETGCHFPQTLAYRDALTVRLGLTDVRDLHPDPAEIAARDAEGSRHLWDPDGCCALRKVAPLERGLAPFAAWISGRKRHQAATRAPMPIFEADRGRIKLNPLADWTAADVAAYAARHDLPPHPLVAQGYLSIGCAPCTTPVRPGEGPRAGRWRSLAKVECGIHVPGASALPTAAFEPVVEA